MLRIGTRGSALALTQARGVAAQLAAAGVATELQIIRTQGDRIQHLPFDKMEGKGFFTKEIEAALLAGDVDLAVHSLKDLPSEGPPGLTIAAVPARVDPRDCLLVRPEHHAPEQAWLPLRAGARVGTSAVRRRAQLEALRPDLVVVDLRGNVGTRVDRLRAGDYDAVLLACAGLARLALAAGSLHLLPLAPEVFVPAPAQGALALQSRADDAAAHAAVAGLHAPADAACVAAERAVLARLQGGCHVPLGALARHLPGGEMALEGFYRGRRAAVRAPDVATLVARACAALGVP